MFDHDCDNLNGKDGDKISGAFDAKKKFKKWLTYPRVGGLGGIRIFTFLKALVW